MSDTRYTVKDTRDHWIGTVIVGDDGLVTIYGRGSGTYGHFWPGEQSFGKAGIRVFLLDIDEHYAADKFTMHMHPDAKTEGKWYIYELWPQFVKVLRAEMNAETSNNSAPNQHIITAAAEWLTKECGMPVCAVDVQHALRATAGECTKIGLAAKAFVAAMSSTDQVSSRHCV